MGWGVSWVCGWVRTLQFEHTAIVRSGRVGGSISWVGVRALRLGHTMDEWVGLGTGRMRGKTQYRLQISANRKGANL